MMHSSCTPAPTLISSVQTVQYIQPQHYAKLSQAELLVIDEVGGWVGGCFLWLAEMHNV